MPRQPMKAVDEVTYAPMHTQVAYVPMHTQPSHAPVSAGQGCQAWHTEHGRTRLVRWLLRGAVWCCRAHVFWRAAACWRARSSTPTRNHPVPPSIEIRAPCGRAVRPRRVPPDARRARGAGRSTVGRRRMRRGGPHRRGRGGTPPARRQPSMHADATPSSAGELS
jgi:hypothetical protein